MLIDTFYIFSHRQYSGLSFQERVDTMPTAFLVPNTILFLILWSLSLILFYYIIKTAVRNEVEQANARLLESVRRIERDIHEIKQASESTK
jgi:hypothetical protein